jgi:hypothetical protein
MSSSVARTTDDSPRTRCADGKKPMAKAALQDFTISEKRAAYGQILRRASELAGFNRDQTADALKVDPAQISRWWSGAENPQGWRYQDHPVLKQTVLVAQAEATQGAVVEMLIRLERKAG